MKRHRYPQLWILMLLFALPFLACGLPSLKPKTESLPQPPSGYIEPNEESATRAKENFNQAVQESGGTQEIRYRITSEEITSLVANFLQERGDIPFTEPQIWFTAGKIYISGTFESIVPTKVTGLIVATPTVTEQGQLQLDLNEVKMGQFDVPDSMIENLSTTINETLINLQLDVTITAIDVLEGEMWIAGRLN